ncbi:hypothetical protein [Actinoplanes sp. NPDC049265]|uniref:hypothetical protein n=1 Tax=Actinoplanes sp. NPDC049265 TaxID=3363902 RepID=UPI0037131650
MSVLEYSEAVGYMNYLKGFSPFIVSALVGVQFDWRVSGLTGFLVACLVVFFERRRGRGWDLMVLELSAWTYLAAQTAVAFAFPRSPVEAYTGFISMGWLAAAAWGSLVIGKPFTIAIARARTRPEVWDHPVFIRANVAITLVWAASFTVAAAAGALLMLAAPGQTVGQIVLKVAAFTLPVIFTFYYPKAVRSRFEGVVNP